MINYVEDGNQEIYLCGCIGPQNGEPVCPCRMRSVIIVNGRYKQVVDLGPAKEPAIISIDESEDLMTELKRIFNIG